MLEDVGEKLCLVFPLEELVCFLGLLQVGFILLVCVDLHPIILVSSGPGDGWAASALCTWEKLMLSDARAGSSPWFGSFPRARKG